MAEVLGVVFVAAMFVAMAWDVATYEIPDAVSIALAVGAVVGLAAGGAGIQGILVHAGLAVAMFLLGAILFAAGQWGGGDVKLLAAAGLWFGPFDLLFYLLIVSLAGGAVAFGVLIFRRLPLPNGWKGRPWIARLRAAEQGLPYGVALGLGGILCADRAVTSVMNSSVAAVS